MKAIEELDVVEALRELIVGKVPAGTILQPKSGIQAYLDGTIGQIVEQAKQAGNTGPLNPLAEVKATIKAKAGAFHTESDILAAFAKKTLKNGPESPEEAQDAD